MTQSTLLIIVGALMIVLVPIVPLMVEFRVKVLHAMHLHGLADWHERNKNVLVVAVRIIFVILAVVLLAMGLSGR